MRLEDEINIQCFQSEEAKAKMNVMFTASWLHCRISAHLREFGLSHEQFNVLAILRSQHPNIVAQKDILNRMIERNSNLTRILSKLKAKDLVIIERSASDRREYEIKLSASAIPFLDNIHESMTKNACAMHGLSVSESFHLNALLDKMRELP
jgi:DNA-binding MarR family transcriptional regulator